MKSTSLYSTSQKRQFFQQRVELLCLGTAPEVWHLRQKISDKPLQKATFRGGFFMA